MLFSLKEHENRLKRCQSLMEKEGLDVLILSSDNNVFYMSGYRTQLFFARFRPFICVVPKEGLPTLIIPFLEGETAEYEAWFDEVRLWGAGCEAIDAVSLLKKFFTEKKLLNSNVGMELDNGMRPGMIQAEIEALYQNFNKCQFKSCSNLMWKLRSVKSKEEIDFMRESCRISEVGYQAVVEKAKVGMTERKAYSILGQAMVAEGSELYGLAVVLSGPEHYKLANPWPTDKPFEKGDMIVLDYGAVYRGYWSDLTRLFILGSASDRQKELYEVAWEAQNAALSVIKPGVSVGEIDRIAMQKINDLGYSNLVRHRSGHSIGMELHELPSISSDIITPLEPGMVLCIEPAVYDFTAGHFRIEDEIVVTEKGFERLSKHPRELAIT